jgi:hypothetical protein
MVIRQKCYTVKEIETPGANPIKCKKKGDRDDDDDGHREQRFQEKNFMAREEETPDENSR